MLAYFYWFRAQVLPWGRFPPLVRRRPDSGLLSRRAMRSTRKRSLEGNGSLSATAGDVNASTQGAGNSVSGARSVVPTGVEVTARSARCRLLGTSAGQRTRGCRHTTRCGMRNPSLNCWRGLRDVFFVALWRPPQLLLHGRTCVTSHGLWRGVMMWNLERGQNFRGDCNPSVHTIQEYTLRRSDATHRSSQCLFACHDPCYCRLTWLVARGGNSVLIARSGLKEAAQRATAPPDEHEEDGGVWGWRAGDAHVDATSATPSARCPGPCGSGWCSRLHEGPRAPGTCRGCTRRRRGRPWTRRRRPHRCCDAPRLAASGARAMRYACA